MKKQFLVLDFIRYPVPQKIAFYRTVIKKVDGNAYFPNPDVTIAVLISLVDALEAAYIAAQDGGKTATATMHDCVDAADAAFRKLAAYVERVADGDETIILSSGFNLSKEPNPVKKVELSVTQEEESGVVFLKRQAVSGAKTYIWQYCSGDAPAAEEAWTFAGFGTQVTFTVRNLTPGVKYWFRVAVVTSKGTEAYCSPVSKMVI